MSVEFDENNKFKNLYAQGNQNHAGGSGIIGWLIKNNVVSNEKGANTLLIIITIICLFLSAYIFTAYGLGLRVFSSKPAVTKSTGSPINFQEKFQNKVPENE
jgi:hypothetical protein